MRTYDVLPPATKAVVDHLASSMSIDVETVCAAVVAQEAISRLSLPEQGKAIAVLVGLHSRNKANHP